MKPSNDIVAVRVAGTVVFSGDSAHHSTKSEPQWTHESRGQGAPPGHAWWTLSELEGGGEREGTPGIE